MPRQPELFFAGEAVRHVRAGCGGVVSADQSPVRGLEWLHGPNTVYVWTGMREGVGQRVPYHRLTLEVVSSFPYVGAG